VNSSCLPANSPASGFSSVKGRGPRAGGVAVRACQAPDCGRRAALAAARTPLCHSPALAPDRPRTWLKRRQAPEFVCIFRRCAPRIAAVTTLPSPGSDGGLWPRRYGLHRPRGTCFGRGEGSGHLPWPHRPQAASGSLRPRPVPRRALMFRARRAPTGSARQPPRAAVHPTFWLGSSFVPPAARKACAAGERGRGRRPLAPVQGGRGSALRPAPAPPPLTGLPPALAAGQGCGTHPSNHTKPV